MAKGGQFALANRGHFTQVLGGHFDWIFHIKLFSAGLNLKYHANANTTMDKLTKYGLAGSIHEKLATILLLPASNAITGVIQQSEAAMAARTPAPVNVPDDLAIIIPFPVFEYVP